MLAHPGLDRARAGLLAMVAAAGLCVAAGDSRAGVWVKVIRSAPGGANLMLLLSDGTIMADTGGGNAWHRLTPDDHGRYTNGQWTTLAPMHDTRLYYSSQVLKDGRVFVAGGEYGTGGAKAEVYDPIANTWTQVDPPASLLDPAAGNTFYDSNSEILPNGYVLIAPVGPKTSGATLLFRPNTMTWSAGPKLFRGYYQDEATWVKLPDNTILTIDPFGTNSERYDPLSNKWINDSNVPVAMYDPFAGELGAGALLPDGRAFFLGSTGHTVYYTPTGTTAPGVWTAGPDIPEAQGTPDAPAAMMVTGKVLCAVSPLGTASNGFPSPTRFYEFDPATNTFSLQKAPVGTSDNIPSFVAVMLTLPDGNVLYSHGGGDVYVYKPTGAPVPSGKPTVASITPNGDGSFHLTGTGLNGISEGASYGDDHQMNSNYPLVRLTDSVGHVYYGRTYNWSGTGVRTGAQVVTTEYTLPADLPQGELSLYVIANGFASDAVTRPTIVTDPAPQSACIHGSASFGVAASGVGPLSYRWYRGAVALSNSATISGADTPTLTVHPTGIADAAADYRCEVSNVMGARSSATAELTVCVGDFDCSGFVDTNDFDSFVQAFEVGSGSADVDGTGFVDTNDFDAFVQAFEAGC